MPPEGGAALRDGGSLGVGDVADWAWVKGLGIRVENLVLGM